MTISDAAVLCAVSTYADDEPPTSEPTASDCWWTCQCRDQCERLFTLYGEDKPWEWCECGECHLYEGEIER